MIASGFGVGVSLEDAQEAPICSSGATLSAGWHQIAWTYNNGANVEYLDGALVCRSTFLFYSSAYNGHNYTSVPMAPNGPTNGAPFYGVIDETRVSNISRSSQWIQAEYNSQMWPTAFYAIGIQQ